MAAPHQQWFFSPDWKKNHCTIFDLQLHPQLFWECAEKVDLPKPLCAIGLKLAHSLAHTATKD
jgi:hypothetical protein